LRLLGMGDTSAVRLLAPPVLNLSSCPIFRVHFRMQRARLTWWRWPMPLAISPRPGWTSPRSWCVSFFHT